MLTLLEALGLKQYHDTFKEEKVSGEILSECDEEVLTNDLGIKSKLHRIKLIKEITGRHSAKRIMAGEDPYAHETKQQSSETAAIEKINNYNQTKSSTQQSSIFHLSSPRKSFLIFLIYTLLWFKF